MDPLLIYGGLRSYVEVYDQDSEQRGIAEWLNSILPNLNLPIKASEAELRACLLDDCLVLYFKMIPKLQLFGNSCWHWIFLSFRLRSGLERVRVYKICICKLCFLKERPIFHKIARKDNIMKGIEVLFTREDNIVKKIYMYLLCS